MIRVVVAGLLLLGTVQTVQAQTEVPCNPICNTLATDPVTIVFDALDPVTQVVLVIDNTKTTIPMVAPAGAITLPPRTLTVGSHPAQVGVCNEFGCSTMTPFEVRAGVPPPAPTSPRIRLVRALVDSLRFMADQLAAAVVE